MRIGEKWNRRIKGQRESVNMEWDNGDKRERKWKWMSGVWQAGETGKRGNEERGMGDGQRSNRLDGNNEKRFTCVTGNGETLTMEQ